MGAKQGKQDSRPPLRVLLLVEAGRLSVEGSGGGCSVFSDAAAFG